MKLDDPEYRREFEALLEIVHYWQKHAQMPQHAAATAAGRTQSWWSKVTRQKFAPDAQSIHRFLTATGADNSAIEQATGLCDKLRSVETNHGIWRLYRLDSDKWREAMKKAYFADRITIVSPLFIPVELCTEAMLAVLDPQRAEAWRRRGYQGKLEATALEESVQYRFLISEAAVLSAFALPRPQAADQLKHLAWLSTRRGVDVLVVPLSKTRAPFTASMIVDDELLIAEAYGGALINSEGIPLVEAMKAVEEMTTSAVTGPQLTQWLTRQAKSSLPLLLGAEG